MGSERVVGVRSGGDEVSGIVPQSLVELFRLLEERVEAGSGREDETETWGVRVGYLQVRHEVLCKTIRTAPVFWGHSYLKLESGACSCVRAFCGLRRLCAECSKIFSCRGSLRMGCTRP